MSETLRRITLDDAAMLARLHASAFDKGWKEDEFRALLESPFCFGFLAESGFILARAAANEAEILTLAVWPSRRRQGLGRALVRAAAGHLAANEASVLFLEVAAANGPARALYEGLGFTATGRRKAYYDGEDALVLKADLPLD